MGVKTWKAWTSLEEVRLEELRLAGLTAAQIAAELGRTVPSVKCRLAIEQIRRPAVGRERWAQVLAVPRPIQETAALMGVSHWAVKQAARKLRRAGFDIPKVRRRKAG